MCTAVACIANRLPTSILVLYKHSYESRVQCICSPFCCLCLSLALLFAWIQDGRVRWWSLQQVCQSCKVGYKSSVINQPEKLCRLLTVNHSLFFWQSFNLLLCWANFFLYEYQSFLVKQTFVRTNSMTCV